MISNDQRPSPYFALLLLIVHPDTHVRCAQQGRRAVHIDSLVLTGARHESLMEDADVFVSVLLREAVVPVPSGAVDIIVREPVEVLNAAEVDDEQQAVVRLALVGMPIAEAQHAVLVPPPAQVAGHGLEMLGYLASARGQGAEGVVDAHAEVENDEGLGGGLGAEGACVT